MTLARLLERLEAELAAHAASSTPEQFRRHVDRAERQRRTASLSRAINRDTGRHPGAGADGESPSVASGGWPR